jgi:hypothetical protein
MKNHKTFQIILFFKILVINYTMAQNPIITDQFSADPSARVFNGRVYVYPSHDILAKEGKGRPGWFCMEDYHVFSSENLTDWTDHGVIVSQNKVNWVDSTTYSMWAPDCIERNGKYYFYFPANNKDVTVNGRKAFSVGVAIANKPEGPYIPQPQPIQGIMGIDPNVFIDKDGQAYIYYSMGKIFVARLKANMLELDSEPQEIKELPQKGLKEGPWLFERNGLYYMTYPHVENTIERLEYAIGNNPMGPFKFAGVIMDESPMNCWTNHQSLIEYQGQWYLFYHQNAYSPKFDKNRAACIDSIFFNEDGTIQKVIPTLRGVGTTGSSQKIQIDRYSSISGEGVSVEFIDTSDTFQGWKAVMSKPNSWIKYNAVDFGTKKAKTIQVKVLAENGGMLRISIGNSGGPVLSQVKVPGSAGWQIIKAKVKQFQPGIQNLVVETLSDNEAEIDWVSFK